MVHCVCSKSRVFTWFSIAGHSCKDGECGSFNWAVGPIFHHLSPTEPAATKGQINATGFVAARSCGASSALTSSSMGYQSRALLWHTFFNWNIFIRLLSSLMQRWCKDQPFSLCSLNLSIFLVDSYFDETQRSSELHWRSEDEPEEQTQRPWGWLTVC